ncbi:cation:proton antiporter [Acholeplasma granularum]|uniref:cation:proton antiporter n=1 Tax=Acholeplasma granularum TaxID=264635 RepID=UPI0004712D31|nr:cation:proton antiporter [Acholeplasma granularum]
MDLGLLLTKVAVILLVGFIGSLIARKFKLPNVSGYLVLGLLLGPSLGLIFPGYKGFITLSDQNVFKFISEIALAFIAFSIGSEFAIKRIKKMGKEIITLTTFEVIGAVVVVFVAMLLIPKPDAIVAGFAPFEKPSIAFALILASMSAATAPAATLMVIRQYRANGPVTKAIVPITALDDIFGIVVFGFFLSFAQLLLPQGDPIPTWLMFSKPFIEVFGSLGIGIIIGFALSYAAKRFDKIPDDIQVLALISIVITVGGLTLINQYTESLGISLSPLLANIMIGSVIANVVKQPNRTFSSINDLATPFYIIFFTLAGASLDLAILKQDYIILIVAGVYIIARGSGKILGIMVGSMISKSHPNIKKYLGWALLPQGGVSIGLLTIVAVQMTELYPVIAAVIMLSILVYETMGPIFAKFALTKSNELYSLDNLNETMFAEDTEN